MTHYCLDEIDAERWTTRQLGRDDPFVVCAVCERPRADTIDERDAMKRRLHVLASNLAVAGGLCEAFMRGSEDRMAAMLGQPSWRPGHAMPSAREGSE